MNTERRVDKRISHSLPTIQIVSGRRLEHAEVEDASYRGLLVRMSSTPALRTLLKLRLELPGRTLIAHAVVARIVDPDERGLFGVGMYFFALGDPDKTEWERFLAKLLHERQRAA